ncbi:MAG: YeeE/YedE family protein [Acidobacteria bacterium]|nr:YeeE/YedE family protein [Acidobacteriota bacterium]MBV9475647.1 YeeE/YedE family protein [Acidobacteriota bacterium]
MSGAPLAADDVREVDRAASSHVQVTRAYADPYVAGVALGLVLLAAFVVMGRGLGASGAFASSAAGVVSAIAPRRAATNEYFARYLAGDGPWRDWLLFELIGVILGGFFPSILAGRFRFEIARGPRLARTPRLALALAGGALMGTGAVLARGCTSGLALTGGALLSVGSWLFIAVAFASAFAVAPLVRKAWR